MSRDMTKEEILVAECVARGIDPIDEGVGLEITKQEISNQIQALENRTGSKRAARRKLIKKSKRRY